MRWGSVSAVAMGGRVLFEVSVLFEELSPDSRVQRARRPISARFV